MTDIATLIAAGVDTTTAQIVLDTIKQSGAFPDPAAVFTLADYEHVSDGVNLHFVSPNPGPGQPSDWFTKLSDSELAACADGAAVFNAGMDKLRKMCKDDALIDSALGMKGSL